MGWVIGMEWLIPDKMPTFPQIFHKHKGPVTHPAYY
jgi:hypothetical protein